MSSTTPSQPDRPRPIHPDLTPISVLMAVYAKDRPDWLRSALQSVLVQTHPAAELVVVEDGPIPDDVAGVLDEYETLLPTRRIHLPENVGLGAALQIGLEHCRYDYVARADSDDINEPDRFEWQIAAMTADPGLAALGGHGAEFAEDPAQPYDVRRVPIGTAAVARSARWKSPLNHPTVMLRRSDVLAVGGYDAKLGLEDYSLWARLLAAGYRLDNLDQVLVRLRAGSDLSRRRGGWRYARDELALFRSFVATGFMTRRQAVVNLALRLPVRLMPSRLRGLVYRRILRRSAIRRPVDGGSFATIPTAVSRHPPTANPFQPRPDDGRRVDDQMSSQSYLSRIKGAYVQAARGTGTALTKLHVVGDAPPPLDHRVRHWAFSLTRVHDSMAIAELDVPWWTYAAIDVVADWLRARANPIRVFEYGSGASTLWLARRADEVYSVEHHREFATMMQHELAWYPNVELRIVESTPSDAPVIGSAKEDYAGRDFEAYVGAIDDVAGQFDLIVIDGRARAACLRRSRSRLNPGGIIIFDNSARRRYRRAIDESGLFERRLRGLTPTLPYPDQTSVLFAPTR